MIFTRNGFWQTTGDATEGKTAFELTNYELTGASGSVVHLTIERGGKKIEVDLKRKELVFPSNPLE